MKYHLLLAFLFLIISIKSHAQIEFEEGYFISESDVKVQCLIRNRDWKKNPTGFEYKLTKDSEVQTAGIQNVKEFGITGFSKYIRATVDIDRSGTLPGKLSTVREPEFHRETVFLQVLVDGDSPLYYFTDGEVTKYFLKTKESEIEQLVYKRFHKDYGVVTNYDFRYQLYSNFNNHGLTMDDVKDIYYNKKDLERFFLKVNNHSDQLPDSYEKQKKDVVNVSLRPGINYSSLEIKHGSFYRQATDFEPQTNFRFGIETEIILPYNRNKWAVILEPTLQYYYETQPSATAFTSKVVYESLEIPVGIRYYIFLGGNSKLFLNTSVMYDFDNHSDIRIYFDYNKKIAETLDVNPGFNFASGIGFKAKNRYSLELRYQSARSLTTLYKSWFSYYRTISVNIGYSLF